jgi:hypothetical protein
MWLGLCAILFLEKQQHNTTGKKTLVCWKKNHGSHGMDQGFQISLNKAEQLMSRVKKSLKRIIKILFQNI